MYAIRMEDSLLGGTAIDAIFL